MTWIFQDGHLAAWLGFTPAPDGHVHDRAAVLHHVRALDGLRGVRAQPDQGDARPGRRPATAVPDGLARTGRIVSTAAGLLAVSFFAFGTSTVSFLQMFGIGTGLAILIDATLVRGVLVPAAMRMLGPARLVRARSAAPGVRAGRPSARPDRAFVRRGPLLYGNRTWASGAARKLRGSKGPLLSPRDRHAA